MILGLNCHEDGLDLFTAPLRKGYWRAERGMKVYECNRFVFKWACSNDNETDQCLQGHEGALCAVIRMLLRSNKCTEV